MSSLEVRTFRDIVRILRENPEWLEEIRKLILTEELLALPQRFDALVKRFDTFLEEEFSPLKQDVATLKQDVAVLKEDVAVLKQDVAVLKQDVAILKEDVTILKQDVAVLKQDVAELKGSEFERRVRERAPAYLGKVIRKCKVFSFEELAEILEEAVDKKLISEEEKVDVLNLDVVGSGVSRTDSRKFLLALEVSVKVDVEDVERAARRALILARAGELPTLGVVVGKEIAEKALLRAEELGVVTV